MLRTAGETTNRVPPAVAGGPRQPTPKAERCCAQAVALPCYEGMPAADVEATCSALEACL